MKIWIDADACPVAIREIICRAAERTKTEAIFVANHALNISRLPYPSMLQVELGFDVADNKITGNAEKGVLVITSDIPLAAEVLEKDVRVLSARGESYTKDNIKARLNMRDFMETMRASGVQTGGQAPLNHSDRQHFANALDRILAKL